MTHRHTFPFASSVRTCTPSNCPKHTDPDATLDHVPLSEIHTDDCGESGVGMNSGAYRPVDPPKGEAAHALVCRWLAVFATVVLVAAVLCLGACVYHNFNQPINAEASK